jgi:cysteine desulfurase
VDRVRPEADPGGRRALAYLDHAATSPLRPEVVEAMAPFFTDRFGNASGSHGLARDARQGLEEARELVAQCLGARPDEVIFTSGGTEGANLAVLGTLAAFDDIARRRTVVHSAVEHAAVRATCRAAARGAARLQGVAPLEVREVPVDGQGVVDLGALETLLDDDVALVSVMAANNETGTIQPLAAVVEVVRRAVPSALVHTDAVQGATYLDLAEMAAGVDLLSISAHKLGGPKGAGALVVRRGVALEPILHGGGQERDRRSGSHDVAGAVGLAAALGAATRQRAASATRVRGLRDRLAQGLLARLPACGLTVDPAVVLPSHCHVHFGGVEQEDLLVLLDLEGVCASGGAACASGALEPSHVLAAMGIPPEEARGAIRFSLGWCTDAAEIDRALAAVTSAVGRLAA